MKDLLKKGFYTGLGAGLLLKDEIMNLLNAPVKVNDKPLEEMREQLRQALSKLSCNLEDKAGAAREAGEEELSALLDRFGLVRAEDVKKLRDRIEELERKLAEKKQE